MKRVLPALFLLLFGLLVSVFILNSKTKNASAAVANHIVISEIQIGGVAAGTTTSDFIELYNPTSADLSLDGMRLGKKTSGTTSASIVAFASDDVIPAHGYFLWCNSSINVSLTCDANNSGTVADDNSVALINGTLAAGTVIDAVTFGTPGTTFGEGTSLIAPTGGTSAERKANSASTQLSMDIGGLDEFMGNAEDNDNNSLDFLSRTLPQAQNSSSAAEPIAVSPTPTATPSPTIEPSPTVGPSATPSPTIEPTVSPTPTLEPSVTPTTEPSPVPTATLTPTPTLEPTATPVPTTQPSPTIEPSPTVAPSASPSPTVGPTPILSPTPTVPGPRVIARGPIFTCTLNYKSWKLFNKTYFFPFIRCIRTVSN